MEGTRSFATVIGKGTNIKGDMSFESDAAILGGFEGKLSAKGVVQIGDGAICKGEVNASSVIVDGQVQGHIRGSKRVDVGAGAKINADIVAAVLVVASGASLEGHFRIGPDELAKAGQPAPGRKPAGEPGSNGTH